MSYLHTRALILPTLASAPSLSKPCCHVEGSPGLGSLNKGACLLRACPALLTWKTALFNCQSCGHTLMPGPSTTQEHGRSSQSLQAGARGSPHGLKRWVADAIFRCMQGWQQPISLWFFRPDSTPLDICVLDMQGRQCACIAHRPQAFLAQALGC